MSDPNEVNTLRDKVLKDRLYLAWSESVLLAEKLGALHTEPPTSGADQEEKMRNIEAALTNCLHFVRRLKEYGK